jgi:hypothetical protein
MIHLSILETNVVKPKLKIDPKSAILKIPPNTDTKIVKRLTEFSIYVIQNLPDIQTVLIGRFRLLHDTYCIMLHNDSRTYYSDFFKELHKEK